MILITGITGKSGTGLVEAMLRHGYNEPFGVVVRSTSDTTFLDNSGLQVTKHVGSIDDFEFMENAMKSGYDTVLHIAAKAKIATIASVAATAGNIKHLILVSSTSLYSNYSSSAESLINAEKEVHDIASKNDMSVTLIRPTMIFGKNDSNINVFIKMVDRLPLFPIVGGGHALLRPVHYKDVGEALYLMIQNQEQVKDKEYIVSGDTEMELIDMLKIIGEQLGKRNLFINVPLKLAQALVNAAYVFSLKRIDYREKLFRLTEDRSFPHDKISDEFGYAPLPFKERLQESIACYR